MYQEAKSKPKYEKHQMVRLKRDRTKSGVVWGEAVYSEKGWQYEVFFSAQDRRFVIESDLEAFLEHEVDEAGQIRFGDLNDLLRGLLLIKLRQPLADYLYGLYASRTKFEVYQFKPALKFLGNPDQRLLIADEVGLGKTIEAGIIYLELQARLDLMRVLVVCPPALKYKWQDEMRSRFDENFTILDREKLENFIQEYQRHGEGTRLRGIVTLHLVRRAEFAEQIAASRVHFDLVIIDEAHHMRNPTTLSNGIASVLSDNADAMLLLTATPLHLGNQDLFHLLQILAPGEFDNLEAFGQRIEPNRHINRASQYLSTLDQRSALNELRKVEKYPGKRRFTGNPYYQETLNLLRQSQGSTETMVHAQRNLLELNTLAHIFTRTRKREVVTDAPVRVARTLKVSFSPQEAAFYEAVIEHVREQYILNKGGWVSGWVTIMRERQAASCISATRTYFEQLLKEQYRVTPEDISFADELSPDEDNGDKSSPFGDFESTFQRYLKRAYFGSLKELNEVSKQVGTIDTKFDVFQRALRGVLDEDPKSKILVFSFFRGTLDYLYRRLSRLGYAVLKIHGQVTLDDRKRYVERFRDDPKINILLSSEVGSEGLDFQYCHTLFNYDLPWNPMKVEQRIGRIDRFGQIHPRLNIYNLVIENSIEERIFLRLYERIGIFKESIGDLEAILGDEIRQISNQIFSTRLTPNQERQLAEQAARSIIRRKQDLEEFEKHKQEFMGQDAIFADEVRTAIEAGRFISEREVQALMETFIGEKFRFTRIEPDEDDPTCALIPGDDLKSYMRDFVYRTRPSDQSAQVFLRRLNSSRVIPYTFSAEIAYQRKLVEFITLRHPLTLAAIDYWQKQPVQGLPVYQICVDSDKEPSGQYYFFIFSFQSEGLQSKSQLVPILVSREGHQVETRLESNFMRLLQSASPNKKLARQDFADNGFNDSRRAALQYAANQRDEMETELQRSNDALVNARLSALEQTYKIKTQQVRSYLRKVSEPRIRRMREAQLRNIESRYRTNINDIEGKRKVSVSYSLELAGLAEIAYVPKKKVVAERKAEAYQLGDTRPTKVVRAKPEPAKPAPRPPAPSRKPAVRRPRRREKSFLDRLAEIFKEMFG